MLASIHYIVFTSPYWRPRLQGLVKYNPSLFCNYGTLFSKYISLFEGDSQSVHRYMHNLILVVIHYPYIVLLSL